MSSWHSQAGPDATWRFAKGSGPGQGGEGRGDRGLEGSAGVEAAPQPRAPPSSGARRRTGACHVDKGLSKHRGSGVPRAFSPAGFIGAFKAAGPLWHSGSSRAGSASHRDFCDCRTLSPAASGEHALGTLPPGRVGSPSLAPRPAHCANVSKPSSAGATPDRQGLRGRETQRESRAPLWPLGLISWAPASCLRIWEEPHFHLLCRGSLRG